MRLLGKLEEHDDVQNVYANFDIDDDLMAKIEEQLQGVHRQEEINYDEHDEYDETSSKYSKKIKRSSR